MAKGYTSPSPFRDWLSQVLWPPRWGMLKEYDPEWDHFLRVALTLGMVKLDPFVEDRPETASRFTVRVGDDVVWESNYPYSYGYREGTRDRRNHWTHATGRPSFETMRLLRNEATRLRRELKEKLNNA